MAASAVVVGVDDAVERRIAQVQVGRRHIDLRAQDAVAIRVNARPHLLKLREIRLGRGVAPAACRPRLGQRPRAARISSGVGNRQTPCGSDQMRGALEEKVEVVARAVEVLAVIEPSHFTSALIDSTYSISSFDGLVSSIRRCARLSRRTGIRAAAKVEADRLGVPDMQIPVGFRRKPRHDEQCFPTPRSSAMIWRMKSSGGASPRPAWVRSGPWQNQ